MKCSVVIVLVDEAESIPSKEIRGNKIYKTSSRSPCL